ncbi:hypothetical protein SynBIOSU31_00472 [Synechococcus sp. BIOS-U3-1]|nr:hypothetical protein SynBIOSU31_00472 [Synechococcus sp. BIOS-U3-1]
MAAPFTFAALIRPGNDVRSDSASGWARFGAAIPVLWGIGFRGTPDNADLVSFDAHQ